MGDWSWGRWLIFARLPQPIGAALHASTGNPQATVHERTAFAIAATASRPAHTALTGNAEAPSRGGHVASTVSDIAPRDPALNGDWRDFSAGEVLDRGSTDIVSAGAAVDDGAVLCRLVPTGPSGSDSRLSRLGQLVYCPGGPSLLFPDCNPLLLSPCRKALSRPSSLPPPFPLPYLCSLSRSSLLCVQV